MSVPRLVLLGVLAAGIAVFLLAGGHRALTFDQLVSHKDSLVAWAGDHPVVAPAAWLGAYVTLGFFGLPGSTVLNLTAGLLFEFPKGLALVVLGSTLASAVAFLSFRYLFRGLVEPRARRQFPGLVESLEREGIFFVLTMRLLPVIPYSATNVILAISPVRFWPCLLVSLIALSPRYVLYVYAGTQLGDVRAVEDLWSARLTAVLAALAALPWLLRWAVPRFRKLFRPG